MKVYGKNIGDRMLRRLRRPKASSACGVAGERYFKCHHKSGTAIDVVAIEIAGEVAISFTHSQYDTRTHSHCIISQVM